MEPTVIQITCEGAFLVDVDTLSELHQFKRLEDEDYIKLRNSFTDPTIGFTYPISVWTDPEGKMWTVDGRSRTRTIKRMRDEGFVIPLLPANRIFAKDKDEAAKRIIASESQYGDIIEDDFTDFLKEYNIDWSEVEDWANIPEFTVSSDETPGASDGGSKKGVICPNCSHHFTPGKENYE